MENQRLLLYFTLFFILYLLWAEWQMDYGPRQEAPVPATEATQTQAVSEVPEAEVPEAAVSAGEAEAAVEVGEVPAGTTARRIRVLTDVLDIEIDT